MMMAGQMAGWEEGGSLFPTLNSAVVAIPAVELAAGAADRHIARGGEPVQAPVLEEPRQNQYHKGQRHSNQRHGGPCHAPAVPVEPDQGWS